MGYVQVSAQERGWWVSKVDGRMMKSARRMGLHEFNKLGLSRMRNVYLKISRWSPKDMQRRQKEVQ